MNPDPNSWVLSDRPASGVVRLTLNRPDSFNALSSDMMTALSDALKQVAAELEAGALVTIEQGRIRIRSLPIATID